MVNKEDIVKLLNEENIKFELVEHEAVYTMEDIEKLNIKESKENYILVDNTKFVERLRRKASCSNRV